jgi:hypothetical protein
MTAQSSMFLIWQRLDRVTIVLLAVLGSVVVSGAVDMAIWWHNGFTLTELNGSTVRVYDGLNYHGFINRPHADSWMPMQGALEVLRGPRASELYETLFFQDKVKFQYPPTSLVYFLALDELGLTDAGTLNNVNGVLALVNIALVLWLFYVCFQKAWGEPSRWSLAQHLVLLAGTAFLFYPLVRAFQLGQIQIWLDVLFTAACLSWLKGRTILAGVLIGISATIKPQLGVFLIWGLLWAQWPFVGGLLGATLGVGLVSLALFGLHNHLEYLRVLSFIGSHGEVYHANQSMNGLLNRLIFTDIDNVRFEKDQFAPYSGIVSSLTLATTLFLLGVGLKGAVTERARSPGIFDFGLLAICVTMSSPVAWEHHYGILLPLFAIALVALRGRSGDAEPQTGVLALLAGSWILVGNHFAFLAAFKSSWLNVLQSHTFLGGLMLVLIYVYLQKRGARFDGLKQPPLEM